MVGCRQGAMLLNGGVDSSCGHAARAWSYGEDRERGCAWRRKEMVNYLLSESYIIFYTCI